MKIGSLLMYLPNGFLTTFTKFVRAEIDQMGKQKIIENGLYHIASNETVANEIMKSQHLRSTQGKVVIRNIDNAYGTSCVCFYNGTPDIEQFIKQLANSSKNNPYLNPTMAKYAIKVQPSREEELKNYKARALADNAIIYEGYCVLPPETTQKVILVPDLVRDSAGQPVLNEKTGRYDIVFREATEEELNEDRKTYKAKDDYLRFVESERERLGYSKMKFMRGIDTQLNVGDIEGKTARKHLKMNLPQLIKRKIQQFMTPKLEMGTDEKIDSVAGTFNTRGKNPYRDKKFGEAVAEFQKNGLVQLSLKDVLQEMTTSDIGRFFRGKYSQIDREPIIQNGIHGISHNDRVAILTMIIAQREGVFENDTDDRLKDILMSAAYYHDIGRKKGIITDNYGTHGKNSARKIRQGKANLKYLDGKAYTDEDTRLLQAIVEAHEGKDKNMARICAKYKVKEEEKLLAIQLMTILKDADALDRVRLDANYGVLMKTDMDPKYLRTNTSKQLLNASYQLESLYGKVSFDRIIAYKTDEQKEGGIIKSRKEKFTEALREGVIKYQPVVETAKKKLRLQKEKCVTKLQGNGVLKAIIRKMQSRKQAKDQGQEM